MSLDILIGILPLSLHQTPLCDVPDAVLFGLHGPAGVFQKRHAFILLTWSNYVYLVAFLDFVLLPRVTRLSSFSTEQNFCNASETRCTGWNNERYLKWPRSALEPRVVEFWGYIFNKRLQPCQWLS